MNPNRASAPLLSNFDLVRSALRKGYVLQFPNKYFLNDYTDDGVAETAALSSAKVFWQCPSSTAELFHARILVVLISGNSLRRTILDASRGCGDSAVNNQVPARSEDCAGVREADGAATPPPFPIQTLRTTRSTQLDDGKRLLFHFIEEFLTVKIYGLQSGFGVRPDSLLFIGPHGGTLAVPVDILLEPREIALKIVQEKIRKSAEAFAKRTA